jgi:hypothetical protein
MCVCEITEGCTYRSEIFDAILDATEDEGVPQRVKLVAAIVHDAGQEIVDIQWPQVVTIVPHCISYSASNHNGTTHTISYPPNKKLTTTLANSAQTFPFSFPQLFSSYKVCQILQCNCGC